MDLDCGPMDGQEQGLRYVQVDSRGLEAGFLLLGLHLSADLAGLENLSSSAKAKSSVLHG